MLNPLYWLSMKPANMEGLLGKITFGFFLLLVIVALVCRFLLKQKTRDRYVKLIGSRLMTLCFTMGFLGIILFFFSYEGIQFFGARFWYPIWDIAFLLWVIAIVRFALKDVPAMRAKDVNAYAKAKYMGSRKK